MTYGTAKHNGHGIGMALMTLQIFADVNGM